MKKFGIVALLALVVMSFSSLPAGYKVGDKATDFKLKSVDGKMYSMADYKDAKGFIVVFTCNHCPFAVKYEDRIVALAKKYKSLGYELIAINPNDPAAQPEDSFDLMKVRAKEKGFTFPYLFDEGQKIYPQYGATKTPHVFLLDKSLTVKYIGAIDDNVDDAAAVKERYLENAIAALEKNQEANPSMTKAIGCSIKVKK
ncbi:thioredoxin family protein [Flavobacterium aquatile]|uniref:Redoxin n=1 Tax=Flavobacterium aquatile LMG 4008 = ATCC 11947 TaxID=1453498 RepID=A0A095V0W8_9FLAO|nr:thioredoxin family protein [Flavobacterium aquatile]KGD68505.1 redoxin [Flavobacterium aquatile LMG 4008 = ATCC 11947]OXA68565.1 thioredoxin family protein [Flavobacterium aquatile LMG 4008 = ATCC 11947]GEC79444.1 thioredoxin family protein [Flavobacterium aquatile]